MLTEISVVLYVLTSVVRTVSTGPGTEISFVCVTSFVGPGVSVVKVVVI